MHLVGSDRLDVMDRPDIDLIVTADEPRRDDAITVTKQFLDLGHFHTVGFANWNAYQDPGGAKGYYWELRTFRLRDGVPYIASTATMVRMVAVNHRAFGWDGQQLQEQTPHLTLGQAFGASSPSGPATE